MVHVCCITGSIIEIQNGWYMFVFLVNNSVTNNILVYLWYNNYVLSWWYNKYVLSGMPKNGIPKKKRCKAPWREQDLTWLIDWFIVFVCFTSLRLDYRLIVFLLFIRREVTLRNECITGSDWETLNFDLMCPSRAAIANTPKVRKNLCYHCK